MSKNLALKNNKDIAFYKAIIGLDVIAIDLRKENCTLLRSGLNRSGLLILLIISQKT